MAFWKLTVREFRRHPGRAVLTLLSIAIGIAAVVSVSLATRTTREAAQQMYEAVTGRAALEVTAEGSGTFPETLAAALGQIPGVKAAVPSVQRFTVLYFAHKRFQLFLMGTDPAEDAAVRDYELTEGSLLEKGNSVLLEANFAEGAGIRLHDKVRLQTPSSSALKEMTVVGLLAPRGAAGFNKGGTVFLPLKTAQRLFLRPGYVNHVDIVPGDSADEEALAAAIRSQLPPGLHAHPPAMRTQVAREKSLNIELGLQFASMLTVALAIFIIANTFLMNVGERRGQLAVLRAVGATRGQVVRMLLGEGFFLGVVGTVLGCLAGALGGRLLMDATTHLFGATPPPVQFTAAPFLLAAMLGPAMAVIAALIPAIMTTRISPLEAMQPMVSQDRARASRLLPVIGLILWLSSSGLLLGCIQGVVPISLAVPSGVASMALVVLIIPAIVDPLARLVARALHPFLQLEGRLAHRQLLRRPIRTSLTIGVLFIAVGTGVGLGTAIINNVEGVREWQRRTVVADFVVRAMFPDPTTGQAAEMPIQVRDEIAKIPGVVNVDTFRLLNARAFDHQIVVIAMEFTDAETLPLDVLGDKPGDVRSRLLEGDVVVGTVLAQRNGLKQGDDIGVETSHGTQSLRIGGVAVDYLVGGYVVYMHRNVARRLFNIDGADAFLIRTNPKAQDDVREGLSAICREHGFMLHSSVELERILDGIMGGVVGCLWGLLVLGFVVAGFGIANTLTMNVLEQTRELAMLRVVAMTRRQIRKLVFAQAIIIGVIGLSLGTLAGVNTAYLISLCMMPLLGYPVPFVLHLPLLLGCSAAALAFVLGAACIPAERAARLDLLIALQYE